MAMYIPPGRRRRRLLVAVGAAVAVGLVIGVVLGRLTAPTVEDRVRDVRDSAAAALAQLEALRSEYEKQASGDQQFEAGGGVDDALARTRTQIEAAISDAPWLTGVQIDDLHAAIDDLRAAARQRVTPEEFETQLEQASDTITSVLSNAP